jgi:hypothetical protein
MAIVRNGRPSVLESDELRRADGSSVSRPEVVASRATLVIMPGDAIHASLIFIGLSFAKLEYQY